MKRKGGHLKPEDPDLALITKFKPKWRAMADQRRGNTSEMTPQGMTSYRNDSAPECFYYGKIGHIAKFCRKKKANQERYNQKRHAGHLADADADTDPDQNPYVRLFMAEGDTAIEEDESDIWIVDSGASSHMSGKKQWFRNFKESNTGAKVYLGDNSGYEIKGHGDVLVTLPDGKIRNISDVCYVPGIFLCPRL